MVDQINDENTKRVVIECLDNLYAPIDQEGDIELFDDGVRGERCLVFRFAHHLQNYLRARPETSCYYVDCDYDAMSDGTGIRFPSKQLMHSDGKRHRSYVDVIVHRRKLDASSDSNGWFCIEFKKWDNPDKQAWIEDEEKLKDLTSKYDYQIGFFIVLAERRGDVKVKVFKSGHGGKLEVLSVSADSGVE